MTKWVVTGLEIGAFVRDWLAMLGGDSASMRGLLDHADEDYSYGALFMMANIGPRASEPAAEREDLLLYGVLAAYQNDGFAGAPDEWLGIETHLENAFAYAEELTSKGVAENLLRRVVEQTSRARPAEFTELTARSRKNDSARAAAHEQEMAGLNTRDLRAAELFDSSVNIDDMMWSEISNS